MLTYNRADIGTLISRGRDHFVYNYGSESVIKFSIIDYINGDHTKALEDYALCQTYFGKYLLSTEFTLSTNGKYLGKIQPKIIGRYLWKKDIEDPALRTQFEEINTGYQAMMQDGKPVIDFIGQPGLVRQCMSNIFVTPDKRLLIIDATLVGQKGVHSTFLKIFFYFARIVLVWRQAALIKSFIR